MRVEFRVLDWNLGGSKFLVYPEPKRQDVRAKINEELFRLVDKHRPHVVALQEAACYGESEGDAEHLVDKEMLTDYRYHYFPLIDSDRFSFKSKWNRIKESGGWPIGTFFSQGNAFLFHKDIAHFPVWDLPLRGNKREDNRHFVEQVNLDSGLYFGDRNTEPRAALVAHFILNPEGETSPLDVFVVNLHLTTLTMEREGIPQIDMEASQIRLAQLKTIFIGIVSRYNTWKQQGYPQYANDAGLFLERLQPVWILCGDFNFTPQSEEYQMVQRMNFIDTVPEKGAGTKAKGAGNRATLTVDYIFAGPKFLSLDPFITEFDLYDNSVDHEVQVSDHFPVFAKIPLEIP
jgi:endonuclease/exonuclease/phosphatase family metal-dependent hydrolase